MTRINTNVSSLVAQNTLGRSNASLNEALTRLSTGLRINTGKDDPAGLIASENLRSDITSIRRAISNTDRANQVIATADSALGQVSSLLNDIRGLVTESANTGALSDEQIAANQLQLDSSLEALNRIAQTTTFQGRRLLDGSLDFITTAGTNFSNISDLQIDQANLGATGSVSVDVDVSSAATQAVVQVENIPAAVTAASSTGDLDITVETTAAVTIAQATSGEITYGTGVLSLDAVAGQAADGAEGNELATITLAFSGVAGAVYDANTNTLAVTVTTADGSTDVTDIVAAIDAGGDFDATVGANPLVDAASSTVATVTTPLSGGVDAVSQVTSVETIAITTELGNAGFDITLAENASATAGSPVVTGDAGSGYTVTVNDTGDTDIDDIRAAIEGISEVLTATYSGSETFNGTADSAPSTLSLTGGVSDSGGLANDIVIELSGSNGSEVLSFGAGTSIDELVTGITQVSDATGVSAAVNGTTATTLDLTSSDYGSSAFVDLGVIEDGGSLFTDDRQEGTNITATVNGISVTGDGNELKINTATLDLSATLDAGFTGTASFNITGGGALFQLGPDVVSNQQARLGIGSVNTARLGGVSGKLFRLGTGGSAQLTSDNLDTAGDIVQEAIDQVTSLRGRLGAFQRTTLETNKNALNDTLVNLSEAESSIRDADFAAESANLTRSQILVQSGTTVLQIANSNPQNVLALLR